MVNFPLSGAKSPAFFCDCEAKELRVNAHPVRMHSMIFGVAELRMEATPLIRLLGTKFATQEMATADFLRICAQNATGSVDGGNFAAMDGDCSGFRFFDHQVRVAGGGGNNSAAQNFRNDARRLPRTVNAMVGLLIGRQSLSVKRSKAGLVSEQRAAGHGHA